MKATEAEVRRLIKMEPIERWQYLLTLMDIVEVYFRLIRLCRLMEKDDELQVIISELCLLDAKQRFGDAVEISPDKY